jgi:hypothetical protein
MAKYLNKKQHEGRAVTVTTPSLYGSHASMVVRELDNSRVICKDDLGEYGGYNILWGQFFTRR